MEQVDSTGILKESNYDLSYAILSLSRVLKILRFCLEILLTRSHFDTHDISREARLGRKLYNCYLGMTKIMCSGYQRYFNIHPNL
jgi:hypothetical protein